MRRQTGFQLRQAERLEEQPVHACIAPAVGARAYGVRGQRDDRLARARVLLLEGADAARGLESVHAGHAAIHEDEA